MGDFEENSFWHPAIAAQHLENQLPGVRNWLSYLSNDRRRPEPRIPFVKWGGHPVLYRRLDVEAFAERVRAEIIGGAR